MNTSPARSHAAAALSSEASLRDDVTVHLDPVIAALPKAFLHDTGSDETLGEFCERLIIRFFNEDEEA